MRRALPAQPGAWEGGAERAEKAEHEQAKRREFLFLNLENPLKLKELQAPYP